MSPEGVAEWVRKAEIDWRMAKRALADARRIPDDAGAACFHAQQCAEKFLKALLALNDHPVPRTHDLQDLAELLRRPRFSLAKLDNSLRVLNRYAVAIRYPGLRATVAQARQAVRAMESVVKACRPLLSGSGKKPR